MTFLQALDTCQVLVYFIKQCEETIWRFFTVSYPIKLWKIVSCNCNRAPRKKN